MWARGPRKRCTPCKQGWYVEPPLDVEDLETPDERGARERAERDARLAVIRAWKTARQCRALKIPEYA